ncbi:hypothetical protein QAD02_006203 [Eretmocerus hayati]|uniref:Uncharacterized protein n=1 Tax=Eretmocerus hayati TaxID=131215 RepID=A0ACC2N1E4_9HYME|nr:hypothetical protein QAD02_006203 [Eretmocerus hayati]
MAEVLEPSSSDLAAEDLNALSSFFNDDDFVDAEDVNEEVLQQPQQQQLQVVEEQAVQPPMNAADEAQISVAETSLQQFQSFDSVFSLGGKEFVLNRSGTKRLSIGIVSPSVPELKIMFKLHDTKNGWTIQFSKRTWDMIEVHEFYTSECIENFSVGREVFENNRIRMETVGLYNTVCVQFSDLTGTRISMMPATYECLMDYKEEIKLVYNTLKNNIKDVRKRMKLFMDLSFLQLFKSNNVDSRHNYNWLMLAMQRPSDFMDLNKSIAEVWKNLGHWTKPDGQPSTSGIES